MTYLLQLISLIGICQFSLLLYGECIGLGCLALFLTTEYLVQPFVAMCFDWIYLQSYGHLYHLLLLVAAKTALCFSMWRLENWIDP